MLLLSPLALITTSPLALSSPSVAVTVHVPALPTVNTAVPEVAVCCSSVPPLAHFTVEPAGQLTVIVAAKGAMLTASAVYQSSVCTVRVYVSSSAASVTVSV